MLVCTLVGTGILFERSPVPTFSDFKAAIAILEQVKRVTTFIFLDCYSVVDPDLY
jgi:hypothetical protein